MGRPSPATVLATLALFVALSGTGVAQDLIDSAKRLVTGRELAPNAVTSPKVKNNSLKSEDVRDGALRSRDLAPGTISPSFDGYTRAQSDQRFEPAGDYLPSSGKAADAERLDGLDSAAFMPTQRYGGAANPQEGNDVVLFTIPGALSVTGQCLDGDPPTPRIRFDYLSAWDFLFWQRSNEIPAVSFGTVGLNPATPSQFNPTVPHANMRIDAKLAREQFSRMVAVEVHGQAVGNFHCQYAGYGGPLDHPAG